MIKLIWSVLCLRSVVDQQTNNVSLFDVFERLEVDVQPQPDKQISKLVNIPVQYEIVSLWTYKDIKKETIVYTRVDLINPNGVARLILEKELILPVDKRRMRDIMKIQGIPVEESGIYTFKVMAKYKKEEKYKILSELPLEVERKVTEASPLN